MELDEEPVKVCIKDGKIADFSKIPERGLEPDYIGESVGFFQTGCIRRPPAEGKDRGPGRGRGVRTSL